MSGASKKTWAFVVILVLVSTIAISYAGYFLNQGNPIVSPTPTPYDKNRPPLDRDTDGGGMTDFNELYTYPGMNPDDPVDDKAFIAKLPDVEVHAWNQTVSDLYDGLGPGAYRAGEVYKASIGDPLVQWYANHTEITFDPVTGIGRLTVNGENLFKRYAFLGGGEQPSYFLTHGRKGICSDSAVVNQAILGLKGYAVTDMVGKVKTGEGHAWTEVIIDQAPYVVNYNELHPKEGFYEKMGWTIIGNFTLTK